jgi:hypothetical protein
MFSGNLDVLVAVMLAVILTRLILEMHHFPVLVPAAYNSIQKCVPLLVNA